MRRFLSFQLAMIITIGLFVAGQPVSLCAAEPSETVAAEVVVSEAVVGEALRDEVVPPVVDATEELIPIPQGEAIAEPDTAAAPMNVYRPLVRYRPAVLLRTGWRRKPQKQMTLLVEDPVRCGCYAEVPVCVPCCCEGAATVCVRPGVLGRCWVDHRFDCGYCVSVLFRTRGDVVVVYP